MVALIGEAGVGKARLAAELWARAEAGLIGVIARPAVGAEAIPGAWGEIASGQNPPLAMTGCPVPVAWLEGRCLELTTSVSYSVAFRNRPGVLTSLPFRGTNRLYSHTDLYSI
jgi:hypothetical protein